MILPCLCHRAGPPATTAQYSLWIVRLRNCSIPCAAACAVLAKSTTPPVRLSRRCSRRGCNADESARAANRANRSAIQRAFLLCAALNGESRGFVDGDDCFVFVENLLLQLFLFCGGKRNALCLHLRRSLYRSRSRSKRVGPRNFIFTGKAMAGCYLFVR